MNRIAKYVVLMKEKLSTLDYHKGYCVYMYFSGLTFAIFSLISQSFLCLLRFDSIQNCSLLDHHILSVEPGEEFL